MTPARTRLLRLATGAIALALVFSGFFVQGLHQWMRVAMFVAIVGIAAWGRGAQTQLKLRQPEPVQRPSVADVPAERTLAD